MAYIEQQHEVRGRCLRCNEPVRFYRRTYLVNFDPAAFGAGSIEKEFLDEQARDEEYEVACLCKHE